MNYLFDKYNWDPSYPTSISNLLRDHIVLTLVSVAIGLAIAFPVGVYAARHKRVYTPVITVADVVYTLPSLAFMALLIPFTGLNPPTVVIPLVLYTQIVLIRNITTGIQAVDPTLMEVGRAMGMTERQVLLRVALPLALPVIVAGIRVATVTTIGIAAIAPLFGVNSLGYLLVIDGPAFHINSEIVAGVILISALAIVADLLLLGAQTLLSRGRLIARTA
ncbi:MAG TPA: ABC transporter permease [Ktedonobacterales bacterium]|nr:ABC transporter permease [Ktedonobacterales bacterium]